jgi:hypothetical protein
MSRRAETIKTDALRISRKAQRTKADEPGAEERRRLDIVEHGRYRETVSLVCDCVLGIAAIDLVPGKPRTLA